MFDLIWQDILIDALWIAWMAKSIVIFPSEFNNIIRAAMAGKAPRPGPCLDFGFQYALIRNNWSKNLE